MRHQSFTDVPVSAGTKLIFFIAAGMAPRFQFRMKITLITHVLVVAEQCLHQVKDFPASHTALPVRRLGLHQKLGGDTQTGQMTQTGQRYVPRHMTVGSTIELLRVAQEETAIAPCIIISLSSPHFPTSTP